MSTRKLLTSSLKRAPFCIFSKRAPNTLPAYDVNKDFCYFFFNDNMEFISGLSPHALTEGNPNAKTDFPRDYEKYFRDDAAACQEFPFPKVKYTTEPWVTPKLVTVVQTRKTAMIHKDENFMLGCFGPHDDIELGITDFRASSSLPPELPPLEHVPASWYESAFQQLPLPTLIVDNDNQNSIVTQNTLAEDFNPDVWQPYLEYVSMDYESFEFCGERHRLWVWRPDPNQRSTLAITLRTLHTRHPKLVADLLNDEEQSEVICL